MTRERFTEIVLRARDLLERIHAPALTIHGLDLGLGVGGPIMHLKISADSRVLDCMVRRARVWDRDERQALIETLDWIMPGERGLSVDETIGLHYHDDSGLTAMVYFDY